MIKGIGIDAVELPRITRLIEEKPKFIARILTSDEMKLFQSLPFHRQVEFLGGRYACKEAFSKAWGTGIGKVTFQDVDEGKVWVSITHTNETAFAQIILED